MNNVTISEVTPAARSLRAHGPLVAEGQPPPRGPRGELVLIIALTVALLASAGLGQSGCARPDGGLADPTSPHGRHESPHKGQIDLERPRFEPVTATLDEDVELPSVADACQLSSDSVFFEPESAELTDSAMQALGSIGWCLTAGPLKDVNVELIGFTDPSPDNPAYRQALSTARALAVADYLATLGVVSTRMELHSAGEPDLAVTRDFEPVALDPNQYQRVRRVLVRIDPD